MSDLEELGFIHSPHTSAGRVPTRQGYRMFIDYLLTVEPLKEEAVDSMQSRLASETDPRALLSTASEMLSNVTHFAGLILIPAPLRSPSRRLRFYCPKGVRI